MTIASAPLPMMAAGGGSPISSPRLRANILGGSAVLHLALLVGLGVLTQHASALQSIDIDIVPRGDAAIETVAIAGAAEAEQADRPVAPEPPTEQVVAPDPDANANGQSAATMADAGANNTAASLRATDPQATKGDLLVPAAPIVSDSPAPPVEHKTKLLRTTKIAEAPRKVRRHVADTQGAFNEARQHKSKSSQAHRAGLRNGADMRAARLSYGALISAELNRHKFYPAAARARGDAGSVGVVFSVGGSGRIASHSIYRSSGSAALDGAIHAMMAAAHAPPPPGGSFRGSIVVNFNMH